jgi:hypothetical protein
MIVCELGNIPPHSVPIVIREMTSYEENDNSEGISSDEEDDLLDETE